MKDTSYNNGDLSRFPLEIFKNEPGTNCVSVLGHDPAWYDVTMDEMRAYLGLLIFMGINKLPDYKLHWSKNKFLGNSGFIDVMHVWRYEKITQYLHCTSGNVDDPLCKIRPI